jgi:hypothetical protein
MASKAALLAESKNDVWTIVLVNMQQPLAL